MEHKELGNATAMTEQMKTEMQRLQLHMYWLQKTSVLNPCEIGKKKGSVGQACSANNTSNCCKKTSSELIRNIIQKKEVALLWCRKVDRWAIY